MIDKGGASALDIAVAAATAAGGVGAAIGASAAWLAARASRRTSRDALAALAVGLRPSVSADVTRYVGGEPLEARLVARVHNTVSEFDALEVQVEVLLRSGETIRGATERLGPSNRSFELTLIRDAPDVIIQNLVDRMTVRYWDARHIARYELEHVYFTAVMEDGTTLHDWRERHEQVDGPRPSSP